MGYKVWKYLMDRGYQPVEYIECTDNSGTLSTGMFIDSIYQSYEVKFQSSIIGEQQVCGYNHGDLSRDVASMSYVYYRANPDSFQCQVYRARNEGETILPSTNGLLKSERDTNIHTFKFWTADYNGSVRRSCEFDGVPKLTNSTRIFPNIDSSAEYKLFLRLAKNLKIFWFKRYVPGTSQLISNMYACIRLLDNAAGFYDVERGVFLTNNFLVAGPVIHCILIPWSDGNGNIILTYTGQGDGVVTVESDTDNLGEDRTHVITLRTTGTNPATAQVTVSQQTGMLTLTAAGVPVRTADGKTVRVRPVNPGQ